MQVVNNHKNNNDIIYYSCSPHGEKNMHIKQQVHYTKIRVCEWELQRQGLKGNSTFKNISPKINIHDKWNYVSVIKLKMQIRYRRYRKILTIRLLISCNVFLHGGRSSRPGSLCNIYVYLLMLTWLPKTVVHMFFRA